MSIYDRLATGEEDQIGPGEDWGEFSRYYRRIELNALLGSIAAGLILERLNCEDIEVEVLLDKSATFAEATEPPLDAYGRSDFNYGVLMGLSALQKSIKERQLTEQANARPGV